MHASLDSRRARERLDAGRPAAGPDRAAPGALDARPGRPCTCASAASRSTSAGRASAIRCRRRWPSTPARSSSAARRAPTTPTSSSRREIDWIAVPLAEKKPFLGICLGAQMLARQLGARGLPASATARPRSATTRSARPTHARASASDWPDHRLPVAPRRLRAAGTAPSCWPRATSFRCRRSATAAAYALQFHPDVTHAMMCRWTTRGHERMALPGAKPRDAHFAERRSTTSPIRTWLATFLAGVARGRRGRRRRGGRLVSE